MLPHSLLLPVESHVFLCTTLTLSERLPELIQPTNQDTKLATFLLGLQEKSINQFQQQSDMEESKVQEMETTPFSNSKQLQQLTQFQET